MTLLKIDKVLNWHLTKENIEVANMHMKDCSTSLIIKKWKLKSQWNNTPHSLG